MHLQENRHHQQRLKIILKSSKQHSLFSLLIRKGKTILYKILILFNYVIKLAINEKLSWI
jgi:hypothetical protein